MLRSKWTQRGVEKSDVQLLIAHLGEWLDGMEYLRAEGLALRETFKVLDPARGEIPRLSPSQLADEYMQATAADAILAFLVVSALKNQTVAPSLLEGELKAKWGKGFPGSAVFDQWKGTQSKLGPLDQVSTKVLLLLSKGGHLEPFRIWEIGLALFQKAGQSNFKRLLMPVLAEWIRAHWVRIISEERFRLLRPMSSVPGVEAALGLTSNDERFIAALSLAGSDAVGGRLASTYRDDLVRIADAK
jgi:hypothetical protein